MTVKFQHQYILPAHKYMIVHLPNVIKIPTPIDNPNTQMYDRSLSRLGVGTSKRWLN